MTWWILFWWQRTVIVLIWWRWLALMVPVGTAAMLRMVPVSSSTFFQQRKALLSRSLARSVWRQTARGITSTCCTWLFYAFDETLRQRLEKYLNLLLGSPERKLRSLSFVRLPVTPQMEKFMAYLTPLVFPNWLRRAEGYNGNSLVRTTIGTLSVRGRSYGGAVCGGIELVPRMQCRWVTACNWRGDMMIPAGGGMMVLIVRWDAEKRADNHQ